MEDIGQVEKLKRKREAKEEALKHCNNYLQGIKVHIFTQISHLVVRVER